MSNCTPKTNFWLRHWFRWSLTSNRFVIHSTYPLACKRFSRTACSCWRGRAWRPDIRRRVDPSASRPPWPGPRMSRGQQISSSSWWWQIRHLRETEENFLSPPKHCNKDLNKYNSFFANNCLHVFLHINNQCLNLKWPRNLRGVTRTKNPNLKIPYYIFLPWLIFNISF